jgi:hypothetical protein
MSSEEESLSPDAKDALRLIRALRRLPETRGGRIAEQKALDNLRLSELKKVALILAVEDGVL